jgi:hypothetical protein
VNPDEHHVALPKLYGAPAYARPPRVFDELERPIDPDDLPLEVYRGDGALTEPPFTGSPLGPDVGYPEVAVAVATQGPGAGDEHGTGDVPGVPAALDQGAPSPEATAPETAEARPDDPSTLQSRPFSVRALSRFLQRR